MTKTDETMKVVFLTGLPQKVIDVVTSYTPNGFTTTVVDARTTSEEGQIESLKDADFLIVYGGTLSDTALRLATKLRLVQLLPAGYNGINLELLQQLEIPCANNGGANSRSVADHAVLLMLALYKRLVLTDNSIRDGRWRAPLDMTNTFEMADKLVGIIGMGNIGKRVARRVQGFEAKVQYYDKYPLSHSEEVALGAAFVPLEELFQTSDIITCHTSLTPETQHIVNRNRLALMKSTAVVINTSRGDVVEEAALIQALQEHRIAGAGIDVFETEPVEMNNPLLKMDNVIVSPHSAGNTWETWWRRGEFAYENIQRVAKGEPPLAVVKDYTG